MERIKTLITIVSLLLIGAGLFFGFRTVSFVRSAEHARGTVTSAGRLSEPGSGFPALISFHDRNEYVYEFKIYTRFRMLGGAFNEGDAVDVLYDAKDPKGSAQVNSIIRLWARPAICFLIGLLFLMLRIRLPAGII
jgi:hypothetical protein